MHKQRIGLAVKRLMDVVGSGAALLFLSPVLAVIALVVWYGIGRPILFRQKRPGLKKRLFTMYKFRTMASAVDHDGNPLPDEVRVTKTGRWLRKTSLDELPALINVFRGEMSLVGPRPLLVDYLPLYSPEQQRRHDVRPGITGLAQVMGRNRLSWEERFELDVWYVDNWSMRLDLTILAKTVVKVLRGEDVDHRGPAEDHRFLGASEAPVSPGTVYSQRSTPQDNEGDS
jgi:sugar transferase EpsL